MEMYLPIKHVHMLTAYITAFLFILRLVLDALGKTGWRQTPLRWLPHVNDTILLLMAVSLIALANLPVFGLPWLVIKIVLLFGYIIAGVFAMNLKRPKQVRVIAAVLALAQLLFIFHLAVAKPMLW
ncbi:MAG: SirB2 family protein [Aliidiomarina sp.]|uniref:SirB2 family protein n=1 Tax=Aliidiomarina sp. TaxID=1872439 RepID=UPI0025BB64B8|nr:SirB2 family protein [Aliidiomarina sp.]MCH8501138.1 SirB2 family protein [Aliidiomarina sp.]